ncbi:hypothetical protein V1525DRAFT_65804 [Lipomyces kononenkoae]|uniref:Uncharacterized protein n=1 Tax=Lipomyces kononenkoae TaxID=34357 RepID=A0ACC3SST8_LIPKO
MRMTEKEFANAESEARKKAAYCSGGRYRFGRVGRSEADKYGTHASSLRRFLVVDARLSSKDRRDLEAAMQHVNLGSFIAAGAVSWNCAGSTFNYSGLFVKVVGKSMAGLVGFFAGLNLGLLLGWDVVSYQFKDRGSCRAAMGLVREYPIISAWQRYYGGDRDAMTKIVPSPLRQGDRVEFVGGGDQVEGSVDELRSQGLEGVAARIEMLQSDYETGVRRQWAGSGKDRKPQHYAGCSRGFSGREFGRRFMNSYAMYLSNEFGRPFFDGSFA